MAVDVEDRLVGVRPGVEHQSVAGGVHAVYLGDFARDREHLTREPGIGHRHRRGIGVVLLGDHQDMGVGLGIDVTEREHVFRLMYHGGWYGTLDDPAEQAVCAHTFTLSGIACTREAHVGSGVFRLTRSDRVG